MNLLEQKIIERIKNEGSITFETFMEMALYYPELGYYTSPDITIGRRGDFYTSPHLHSIFGMMIGRQLEEMWQVMGRPSEFHAVEIGAGEGYLCKDMLDYLKNREIFNSLNYIIVEINPDLIKRQKNLLSELSKKVSWVSSLGELNNLRGCIFSNELLDAFPVHLIEKEEELREIYVTYDKNKFIEITQEVSSIDIINYFKEFGIELPSGYRTEINLRVRHWLKDIARILSQGFLLTIDYGYSAREYYDEARSKGTLLCYHKHRFTENPYENIGRQDITAHVNFSSLKKWGAGGRTENNWLLSSGKLSGLPWD
jgi:SAM-dependent MidA family methyltransferase